jgi:DNA-binding MarR family transcriptional regulator
MGETLNKRLLMSRSSSAAHEAVLNLLVAAGHIRERFDRACGDHDITTAQYNVLRILRGAEPNGFARCEVARRMIERAPDVTRLIDRLELRGLVERDRSAEDRRRSVTRITDKGLKLLERLQPGIDALNKYIEERLPVDDRRELSRLLERLYESED